MLALLRAEPLRDESLGPLRERLAEIDARSLIAKPSLWLLPMHGGQWSNAFALASTQRPRVLLSSSLLEALQPEEVGAIYAHEIGHLEYLTGLRIRRLQLLEIGLILLAVLLAPWVGFSLVWPFVVLVALHLIGKRKRSWETDADQRALELSGDAETCIRALVEVHRLALLPRRLPHVSEGAEIHPSLARRAQAIRRLAGSSVDGVVEEVVAGSSIDSRLPLWMHGAKARTAILLENNRISWFEGLETDSVEDVDPQALSASTTVQSTRYRDLVELRVDRGLWGAPVLVSIAVNGTKRSFPLPTDVTTRLQWALDVVDDQLALESHRGRASSPSEGSRRRIAAVLDLS